MIPFLLLAMGIVRVIQGVGLIIQAQQRARNAISLSLSHGLLVTTVLGSMILFWWVSFPLNTGYAHEKLQWTLFEYGLYILPCLIMYLLSDLLFPDNIAIVEEVSLSEHYASQTREVFLLCTVNNLLLYIHCDVFYQLPQLEFPSLLHLLLAGITLPMAIWRGPRLHVVLNTLYLAATIWLATFHWQLLAHL